MTKVNHTDLVREVARDSGVPQDVITKVFRSFVVVVKDHLRGLDSVHVEQLGEFSAKVQEPYARPDFFRPGKVDEIPRKIVGKFRFTDTAKAHINQEASIIQ